MDKTTRSPNSLANLKKGKATQFKSGDASAREAGRKGGQNCKIKKTIAEYLQAWTEAQISEPNKKKLESMGIHGVDTNAALLAGKMIEQAAKGDLKAMQMLIDQIGENKKQQAEIERLHKEIEILELQKKQMEEGNTGTVEDLTVLADLLKEDDHADRADDSLGTV